MAELSTLSELLARGLSTHMNRISETHNKRLQKTLADMGELAQQAFGHDRQTGALVDEYRAYAADAAQRMTLTLDTLRRRGDNFLEHEEAGCPPVLI